MSLLRIVALGCFASCAVGLWNAANAANSTNAVTQVDNVATLTAAGGNFSFTPKLYLAGYYAPGDNGGGNLVLASCTPDLASCFTDGAGNTYKRTDLAGKAILDARMCGVKGVGLSHDDYVALTLCMSIAATLDIPQVSTGGGQVYVSGLLSIPSGVNLDCGLSQPLTAQSNNDFTLASGNMTHVIAYAGANTIQGTSNNGSISNCMLEQSDGPYAPATFVPHSLRDSLNEVAAFSGSALSITASGFSIHNVWPMGFGTCFTTSGSNKRGRMFESGGDCTVGMRLDGNGDALPIQTMTFLSYVTRVNGNASSMQWPVDNVLNDGTGQYKAVLEAPTSDFAFVTGDKFAYQAKLQGGVNSATGYWTAGMVSVVGIGVDGCAVAQCQEVSMVSSQDSQPSDGTALSLPASWSSAKESPAADCIVNGQISPDCMITITSGNMTNVSVGQAVAQTGGCGAVQSSTVVTDVWLTQNRVILSKKLTCAGPGTLTFADQNFAFLSSTDVVVSAVHRDGDCVHFTNSAGLKMLNFHCFGHSIAYNCDQGAGNYNIVNADTGSDEKYFDLGIIGFYGHGNHTGDDCAGGTLTSGILTQHASLGIKIESDANKGKSVFNFVGVGVGPSSGKVNGVSLDNEAGTVSVVGSYAVTRGNTFVASGTTWRNLYPDSTDVSVGYVVGNVLTGTGGTCTTQPQVTVAAIRTGGGLFANGLTQTRAGVCSVWADPITMTGGSGTGAIMTTDGLILTQTTIGDTSFAAGDLYIEDLATSARVNGCGNTFLSAMFSLASGCIGTQNTSITPTGGNTTSSLNDFGSRTFSIIDAGGTPTLPGAALVDNTNQLNDAFTRAQAIGARIVRLDQNPQTGAGRYYFATTPTIPAGMSLYCPGPKYVAPAELDFNLLKNIVALGDASVGMNFSIESGYAGECNFIKSNLATAVAPASIRDAYARVAAFGGIGLACNGDDCSFSGGIIMGFTQAIKPNQSRGWSMDNVQADATNCFELLQSAEGRTQNITNSNCRPLATTSVSAPRGTVQRPVMLPITSFANNGSGEIRATFTTACATTQCPQDGMRAWFINPNGAESAQGGWLLHNVNANRADLQGSDSAYLTGKTLSANVTSGSNEIVLNSTMSTQVMVTQGVTGGCISGTAHITFVQTSYNILYIDQKASCSATENIVIADGASTLHVSTAVIVSGGTGYTAGDDLTLVGGTGMINPAILHVNEVDNGTIGGPGVITDISIGDQGDYSTAIPASPASVTGGSGTGATFTVSSGAQLVMNPDIRDGWCFKSGQTNSVFINGFHCLGHSTAFLAGSGSSRIFVSNAKFNDANSVQDGNHRGIVFTGNATRVTFTNCGVYYSNHRVVDETTSVFGRNSNALFGCNVTAPGGAGLNNSALEVVSGTPGTPKKSSVIFEGNSSLQPGGIFISADAPTVTIADTQMLKVGVYFQQPSTTALVTGCGNAFATPQNWNCISPPVSATTATASTLIDGSAAFWPCNAVGGPINMQVPAGVSFPEWVFDIEKIDSSANVCNVVMSGADTLNGVSGTALAIISQWSDITVKNIGGTSSWVIQ